MGRKGENMALCITRMVNLSEEAVDICLRKWVGVFLLFVLVATVDGAVEGYVFHNSFKIGDWLINYQGGMVRRGLLGEGIYRLSTLTPINPGLYVLLLQVFFYMVLFVFSYSLLARQPSLLPYVLIIFSPFLFTFQLNDLQGGYRKEIVYFAVLAAVTYSAKVYEVRIFERIFYAVLLCYPAVILVHEMLAIFLPYLLAVYVFTVKLTRFKMFVLVLLILPSLASTLASLYYAGEADQAAAIFASLAREGYTVKDGAISWIGKSTAYGMSRVFYFIQHENYLPAYLPLLLLSLIAFIPIRKNLGVIFAQRLVVALVMMSLGISIALFVVALDWGRFIYIHLVSLFLLSLLAPGLPVNAPGRRVEKITGFRRLNPLFGTVLVLAYTQLWHIPHYGKPPEPYAQGVSEINAVAYVRPFIIYSRRVFSGSPTGDRSAGQRENLLPRD